MMRTKSNLKPYMFRSVRRSSSGVISRALYHYYLLIFLLLRIPVMWRYVFCMWVPAPCLLVWCPDVYCRFLTHTENIPPHNSNVKKQEN